MTSIKEPKNVLIDITTVGRTTSTTETSVNVTFYEPARSIIIQYLYHISGYDKRKFDFLFNWIASFFKNLSNRSNVILILYGDKYSGKEILFNDILKPLFGMDYCLQITDNTLLNDKYSRSMLQEKLFYHLCNISKATDNDKVTNKILERVLPMQQPFAQYLITTENPELLYFNQNNNDYTVFHINKKLEDMYIPEWYQGSDTITKSELQKAIKNDLENFAKILKLHPLEFINNALEEDDKKVMLSSLEDKLKSFIQDIKNTNLNHFQKIKKENIDLYTTLESDFKKHQIKQPNLIKYFNILYPENSFDSSRTFMATLRKFDKDFFTAKKVIIGTSGKKYFKIPPI
jgi:hypothetical protein